LNCWTASLREKWEENNMGFPTFDAGPKKLNIPKIRSSWCFKEVCGNPEKFYRLQRERGR
jgi:hypothetical protein